MGIVVYPSFHYQPVSTPTGLLLDNHNALFAYFPNKQRTAYNGSAVRLRRTSPNTLEADIGFTAEGSFNSGAANAHSNGVNPFVVTYYDQSLNIRNATQGTTTAQPVFNTSTTALVFDNSNDTLTVNFPFQVTGRLFIGTKNGSYATNVVIPSGNYNIGVYQKWPVVALVLFPSSFTADAEVFSQLIAAGASPESSFSTITDFSNGWRGRGEITSFPLINTSNGTNFSSSWRDCVRLTSFPLINTGSGTNFSDTWRNCPQLNSFPLIDTSGATSFNFTWSGCQDLTTFPLINSSNVTNFTNTWQNCNKLTSFPLINTSSGINFSNAWRDCRSLTSFPLINTSNGTNFNLAWRSCHELTTFPLIDISKGTNFNEAWRDCRKLASFPANMFDNCLATNYNLAWTESALNQVSVDNILISISTAANTFNLNAGSIGLNSGSSSPPGSAGIAARTNLQGRGWTVLTN